ARFLSGEGWGTDVDSEHIAKPQVLAYALVHHLLVDAAPSYICCIGANLEIFIAKLAPYTNDLYAFRRVGIHQELVSHLPSCPPGLAFGINKYRYALINSP